VHHVFCAGPVAQQQHRHPGQPERVTSVKLIDELIGCGGRLLPPAWFSGGLAAACTDLSCTWGRR
jgi:hypothetical protein